jgi:hypothetical protein
MVRRVHSIGANGSQIVRSDIAVSSSTALTLSLASTLTPIPPALIKRKLPHMRLIELLRVKAKPFSKIEMLTTPEFHSITIDFDDSHPTIRSK